MLLSPTSCYFLHLRPNCFQSHLLKHPQCFPLL
jgi:hypothetical protein